MDNGEKKRALDLFTEKCIWCKDYNGIENDPPCNRVNNMCVDLAAVKRELDLKQVNGGEREY